MFTGIVQGTGKVVSFHGGKKGGKLTITGGILPHGLRTGESVAVDGCCLTVVGHRRKSLVFDVSDETVRKTKIRSYRHGTVVNLERALKSSDRLGGHFVLGHVDGVGRVERIKKNPGSLAVTISHPKKLAPFLIEKGSVAVDGISLTATRLAASLAGRNRFRVTIIPHTKKVTNMGCLKRGDLVNLEMDMLGKYVGRLILGNKSYRT
ncbi:MAG: riboflavin synthase [Deltaproteobacteria bacterium]|nr:riboflavin synthase [Deltaproteobacteria bacterium]